SPPFVDQLEFFGNGPAFVDTNRSEQEFFAMDRFKQRDAFKVVHTLSFFQCFQGGICREGTPHSSIDSSCRQIVNHCLFRVRVLGNMDCTARNTRDDGPGPAVADDPEFSANTQDAFNDFFRIAVDTNPDLLQRPMHAMYSSVRCMIPFLMKSKTCVSSPS